MKTFTITEGWLDSHGIDILEFMDALANAGFDPEDFDGSITITAADDNNDDIPDFLAGLVSDPITTNDSQGGALGG